MTQTVTVSSQLLLANPRGFCAGVERAIEIVEIALEMYGPPVYVRKEIVHNPHVVEALRAKGAIFVEAEDEVPANGVIIFSAHGVAPSVRQNSASRNLTQIEATCPLVTQVHLEAVKYVKDGYSIILIGHAGHDEIIGTMGEAPYAIQLIEHVEDARTLQVPDPNRVVCLTQTTLSVDDTRAVVGVLRQRFPNILVRNDICYATQNRQTAVKGLAHQVDLILVVGAANSSNTVRLMEVARAQGVAAHRIAGVQEIDPAWLHNVTRIGVTSGASTPEVKVTEVIEHLRQRGFPTSREVKLVDENVTFTLPKELRGFRRAAAAGRA